MNPVTDLPLDLGAVGLQVSSNEKRPQPILEAREVRRDDDEPAARPHHPREFAEHMVGVEHMLDDRWWPWLAATGDWPLSLAMDILMKARRQPRLSV